MKKCLFLAGTLVAIVTVIAGWNFNQSENEIELSELALANVEALASGESGNCRCESFSGMTCTHNGVTLYNMYLVCD